jgi:hypothetical protein
MVCSQILNVVLTKQVYIKSVLYHVLTAFVLTVVLGYPWPSSPPLPRLIQSCLYLFISWLLTKLKHNENQAA